MNKQTAIILFVIGFVLWYLNRKKEQGQLVTTTGTGPIKTTTTTVVGTSSGNLVAIAPLSALGFSWASTHEMSFWSKAGYLPNVKLVIPGSTVSGDGWTLGVDGPSIVQLNGIWTGVRRFNPTTLNVGGVGPNTLCYAVVTDPATGYSITVQFTTPSATTPAIVNIPMVAATIPPAPPAPVMVNGVPTWLQNFGVSYDSTKPDASFWIKSTLQPKVKIERADGVAITGVDAFVAAGKLPDVTSNGIWSYVLRFNALLQGTPGVVAGQIYLATISNPANADESITIACTPSTVPALTINQIALVPYVAGSTPVGGGGGTPGSSADIDTFLGAKDYAFTGAKTVGFDTNKDIFQIDATLTAGKVFPFNKVNFQAPTGYFLVYIINGRFYLSLTDFPGGKQGLPVLVQMLVVQNGTPQSNYTDQSTHNGAYRASESSITIN